MGSTFNPQILMEKLAKLNSSQQSIETLSHWCIFHMNKAKYVVEIWGKQFHCSPPEQRLAFLYLANDIIQNSRRKGSEFIGEFWKVLPDALRIVIANGDEQEKKAAKRLITIWDDRKVFGSRGQALKEEFVEKQLNKNNDNGKVSGFKLKHPAGSTFEKVVSGYQLLYGDEFDEEAVLANCGKAISSVVKINEDIRNNTSPELIDGSGYIEELHGQQATLRGCVEQLLVVESSRASLVTNLRDALQEQESKLGEVRNLLQAARSHSEQTTIICQPFVKCNNAPLVVEQNLKVAEDGNEAHSFMPQEEQFAPVMYSPQMHLSEDTRKSEAAAMAAKLTASTASAQMLSYVLSSLASESFIGSSVPVRSGDDSSNKKPKLDTDHSSQVQLQNPQSLGLPGYSPGGAPVTGMTPYTASPTNHYQNFQGSEGFYTQPSQ